MDSSQIIQVNTKSKTYPIYITGSFSDLAGAVETARFEGEKALIVADTNVSELYLKEIKEILAPLFPNLFEYVFEAGEERKNLTTIEKMYEKFVEYKLDRQSVIFALGGGVCGDLAGFAAATYLRGMHYVQIPTTLLSQVDSSVGGKTGADFREYKNLIGAFYQPQFVYINVSVLKTLPDEQFISGMAEVIKHGIIRDKDYFDCLICYEKNITSREEFALIEAVKGSCRIKSEIVAQDENEKDLRKILNFGHTFGHAIETFMKFVLPHGQCVALGTIAALNYSLAKGKITENEVNECKEIFARYGFATRLGVGINHDEMVAEDIYALMTMDKKVKNDQITIIGADRIGHVFFDTAAQKEDILNALRTIF